MSKNVLVNRGNSLALIHDVSKLMTTLSDGSTVAWIPEDEVFLIPKTIVKDGVYEALRESSKPYGYSQVTVNGVGNKVMGELGEKSINKNGIYIAKNDTDGPYYGYSKLVVNVSASGGDDGGGDGGSGSPTITGKDADGDDAIVGTDEDGRIVTSKLPTRISINIYPNNLVYEDGQAIDFTGLRVKAFLPDDTEWGIVDDDQLIKPVTVAEFEEGENNPDTYTPSDDIVLPPDMTSLVGGNEAYVYSSYSHDWFHFIASGGRSAIFREALGNSNKSIVYLVCASTSDSIIVRRSWGASSDPSTGPSAVDTWKDSEPGTGTQATINGRTFYYAYSSLWNYKTDIQYDIGVGSETQHTVLIPHVAYILLFGNYNPGGSQQLIPLQWKRPGDGKVLETSFTIAVHGSDDSGDSGGGSGPEPEPTPPPS